MQAITLLDGGMGKELERIGAPFRQPEWSALALWQAPDMVARAHRNFIAAGAEIVITNTYAVIPYHIGEDRYRAEGRDLIRRAAEIARRVADEAEREVLVAASLPPQFGSYQPELFDPALAPAMYDAMVAEQAPFVDLWLAETIGSLEEFDAAANAVSASALPFWAAFSLADELADGEPVLHSGESVADVARAAGDRCEALLFNCSQPEVITPAIATVSARLGGDGPRIGGYANAFPVEARSGDYSPREQIVTRRDDLTAARYREMVESWMDHGATIVGGCCGIHPEHIAALGELVRR